MSVCGNFVCVCSHVVKGKVYCTCGIYGYDNLPDCTATMENSCEHYKYFTCAMCGHEENCIKQKEKGVFYSPKNGFYVPKSSSDFAKAVQQNAVVNAQHDICSTAVKNYLQGYKTSTTVKQLHDKYSKQFGHFTKTYIQTLVEWSVLTYLECENNQFKERF